MSCNGGNYAICFKRAVLSVPKLPNKITEASGFGRAFFNVRSTSTGSYVVFKVGIR